MGRRTAPCPLCNNTGVVRVYSTTDPWSYRTDHCPRVGCPWAARRYKRFVRACEQLRAKKLKAKGGAS
jgi:hypothetical protein